MIEKNILSLNLNFRKDLSVEAISAIRVMMNPKKNQRPLAKDILKLDFFKMKEKNLSVLIKPQSDVRNENSENRIQNLLKIINEKN